MKLNNIISLTVIVLVLILLLKDCGKEDIGKLSIYQNLNDSTTYYKNKYNETVARNSVLESESVNSFLEIQSKDAEILALQKRVKEYKDKLKDGGNVTGVTTGTTVDNTTGTVIRYDTMPVMNGDTVKLYPIYSTTFKNEWIDYSIDASKDSMGLKLKVTDKYSVIIGSERPARFKKRVSFVEVISESPYTEIKSVKTYKVKDDRKPPRISIGAQIGYGLTLKGLTPYAGFGVQFNLLNIK